MRNHRAEPMIFATRSLDDLIPQPRKTVTHTESEEPVPEENPACESNPTPQGPLRAPCLSTILFTKDSSTPKPKGRRPYDIRQLYYLRPSRRLGLHKAAGSATGHCVRCARDI
uniref:Uncharacterized protein n=1 Tax=Steinernema glaseri TaxID=37863 RepID=A0A1I8AUF6_9BILA